MPLELNAIEQLLVKPLLADRLNDDHFKERSMSARTKSKIRKKVIAFSRVHPKLTFLTLTFQNAVTDRTGIKALGDFLDNVTKRSNDFQYIWVAERQTKNTVFIGNIHFHLITNKFWKIDRWWTYWIEVQKKNKIVARDVDFKPTSAFDVKVINRNNIKGIANYISKYVTKNVSMLRCMTWNCSRKISQLYTDFYSSPDILAQIRQLLKAKDKNEEIKCHELEHCRVYLYSVNNLTERIFTKLDSINIDQWKLNRK